MGAVLEVRGLRSELDLALLFITHNLGVVARGAERLAVPRLDAFPPGCAFAPRCPYRCDECDVAVPEMRAASLAHRARCILIR